MDERFNEGGQLADYIIDYLRRPLLSKVTARDEAVVIPGGEGAAQPGMTGAPSSW